MTHEEKSEAFNRLFNTVDGEVVLEILKEDLGYNKRTTLAEDDRRMYYKLGQVNAVFYILEMINSTKKRNKNVRRSKQQ